MIVFYGFKRRLDFDKSTIADIMTEKYRKEMSEVIAGEHLSERAIYLDAINIAEKELRICQKTLEHEFGVDFVRKIEEEIEGMSQWTEQFS